MIKIQILHLYSRKRINITNPFKFLYNGQKFLLFLLFHFILINAYPQSIKYKIYYNGISLADTALYNDKINDLVNRGFKQVVLPFNRNRFYDSLLNRKLEIICQPNPSDNSYDLYPFNSKIISPFDSTIKNKIGLNYQQTINQIKKFLDLYGNKIIGLLIDIEVPAFSHGWCEDGRIDHDGFNNKPSFRSWFLQQYPNDILPINLDICKIKNDETLKRRWIDYQTYISSLILLDYVNILNDKKYNNLKLFVYSGYQDSKHNEDEGKMVCPQNVKLSNISNQEHYSADWNKIAHVLIKNKKIYGVAICGPELHDISATLKALTVDSITVPLIGHIWINKNMSDYEGQDSFSNRYKVCPGGAMYGFDHGINHPIEINVPQEQ